MMLAGRACATAAAAGPLAATAAAAPAAMAITGRRLMSGLVAGQDTPVSADKLPENLTHEYPHVVQGPAADEADPAGQEREAAGGGGEGKGHPGPQQDPYSGGDPEQGGSEPAAEAQKGGSQG
jgi:hypothetical protein